jgi:hypothetical protein
MLWKLSIRHTQQRAHRRRHLVVAALGFIVVNGSAVSQRLRPRGVTALNGRFEGSADRWDTTRIRNSTPGSAQERDTTGSSFRTVQECFTIRTLPRVLGLASRSQKRRASWQCAAAYVIPARVRGVGDFKTVKSTSGIR